MQIVFRIVLALSSDALSMKTQKKDGNQSSPERVFVPALAFGSNSAAEYHDAELFSEDASNKVRAQLSYRPRIKDRQFRHKVAVIQAPDVRLVAGASTGMQFSVAAASGPFIMMPFHGSTRMTCDSRTVEWHRAKTPCWSLRHP